jgi:hypothetical protein
LGGELLQKTFGFIGHIAEAARDSLKKLFASRRARAAFFQKRGPSFLAQSYSIRARP